MTAVTRWRIVSFIFEHKRIIKKTERDGDICDVTLCPAFQGTPLAPILGII